MDRLANLLTHFSLEAGVFYSGNICGVQSFPRNTTRGHVHVIKYGRVTVGGLKPDEILIEEPSLLFLPRTEVHRLVTNETEGAEVICGSVQFGGGTHNPISDSLPDYVVVRFSEIPGLENTLSLLFEEAFSEHCGRQAILNRLCEIVIIQLLRYCLDHNQTKGGALAGLSDHRLAKVLNSIHETPAHDWTLDNMSMLAGMSRARFAVKFRETVGETPADYLASWRIMTAQRLLKRGLLLKHVAYDVGYGSASALTRAFVRKTGMSPSHWLSTQQEH